MARQMTRSRRVIVTLVVAFLLGAAQTAQAEKDAPEVSVLEARVRQLEARMAKVEERLSKHEEPRGTHSHNQGGTAGMLENPMGQPLGQHPMPVSPPRQQGVPAGGAGGMGDM